MTAPSNGVTRPPVSSAAPAARPSPLTRVTSEMTRVTNVMATPNLPEGPIPFSLLFLIALEATGVTRNAIARACGVLPRTVARWEDGDVEPLLATKIQIINTLHDSEKLPQDLLERLCKNIGIDAWRLGLAPVPSTPFTPSPATTKVLDDAVREAAEELSIDVKTLRPVASRLFEALATYEIPPAAAAQMVLKPAKKVGPEGR